MILKCYKDFKIFMDNKLEKDGINFLNDILPEYKQLNNKEANNYICKYIFNRNANKILTSYFKEWLKENHIIYKPKKQKYIQLFTDNKIVNNCTYNINNKTRNYIDYLDFKDDIEQAIKLHKNKLKEINKKRRKFLYNKELDNTINKIINNKIIYTFGECLNDNSNIRKQLHKPVPVIRQLPKFEMIDKNYKVKDVKAVNARDDKLHRIFKKNVNMIMNKCPITGLSERCEYAHIKPYSISKNEQKYNECIDGFNGIILYNPLHVLFDDGMISFNDDGTLLVSSKLSELERKFYGDLLISGKKYNLGYNNERSKYLQYHRNNIFLE